MFILIRKRDENSWRLCPTMPRRSRVGGWALPTSAKATVGKSVKRSALSVKKMNKLKIIDAVMVIAVLTLIFLKPGKLYDVLIGGIAALFVISLTNHVKNYITTKKFY
jgi:hypothetical protein